MRAAGAGPGADALVRLDASLRYAHGAAACVWCWLCFFVVRTARKKGVTLAGVHLHSGLAQSALLALALQGLAFLVKVASDYGK